MNYIQNLQERKEALKRIIPKVPRSGGRWGIKLDWVKYFAANPFDAPLLGYDQRNAKPELWNRNNVMARNMLDSGKVEDAPPTRMPGIVTDGVLLKDVIQRKELLRKIFPKVPLGPMGQKSWKAYFESNPNDAIALGYGNKANRKIWSANLRMSQDKEFRAPSNGLVSFKHTPGEHAENTEERLKLDRANEEIKALRTQVRELDEKLADCRSMLMASKEIVFDLTLQLRELKS